MSCGGDINDMQVRAERKRRGLAAYPDNLAWEQPRQSGKVSKDREETVIICRVTYRSRRLDTVSKDCHKHKHDE